MFQSALGDYTFEQSYRYRSGMMNIRPSESYTHPLEIDPSLLSHLDNLSSDEFIRLFWFRQEPILTMYWRSGYIKTTGSPNKFPNELFHGSSQTDAFLKRESSWLGLP